MSKVSRIVLAVVFVVGLASGLYAANETYTLRSVTNSAEATQCGKVGGKAGMVADLDSNGTPISQFTAVCLVPVK